MSAFPSAAGLQFSTTSATLTADYSKVAQEDQLILKKWLEVKKSIVEINALPSRQTTERRRRAQDLLGVMVHFEAFIYKYDFLLKEFFELTKTLNQYINAQIKPLEDTANAYFKSLFEKKQIKINREPAFFSKKGGDQLGRQMRIEYLDPKSKEERTIDYFVKTHQGGAKSGQSSARHVDPKELLVYKVLEYTGLGPKAHFFCNPLSQGGFYIATEDCGFSESAKNQKNKQFMTLGALKQKQDIDSKTTNELIKQMKNVIYSGFACADIFSRLFCLRDILTNSGNSGFALDNEQCEFKIIDFSVVELQGSYFSDSIYEGYMSGNGMFNYLNDNFLKKYLKDIEDSEKRIIAEKVQEKLFSSTENYLSLEDAIDKAAIEVFEFVNRNYLNLGINQIPKEEAPKHDFNRYIKDIKSNYGKFFQDLNKKSQPKSSASVRSLDSQLSPFQHVIQSHKLTRSFNLGFVDDAKESLKQEQEKSKKLRAVLDGKEIFFEEHQIIRDGSCGFHTMGTEREAVVKLLLEQVKNPIARNILAPEIETAFRSGESNAITDFAKKLFEEQQKLSVSIDNLQRTANEIIKKKNADINSKNLDELINYFQIPANSQDPKLLDDLEKASKASKEIQSKIVEHVSSELVYTTYVKSLKAREWLGIYSAKAFAYFEKMNLYIWIKDEHNPGALKLRESNVVLDNKNTIHMLYTDGGTHFNLLSEFESVPKIIQSNLEPVKGSPAPLLPTSSVALTLVLNPSATASETSASSSSTPAKLNETDSGGVATTIGAPILPSFGVHASPGPAAQVTIPRFSVVSSNNPSAKK